MLMHLVRGVLEGEKHRSISKRRAKIKEYLLIFHNHY
jgi:hypothetical protein